MRPFTLRRLRLSILCHILLKSVCAARAQGNLPVHPNNCSSPNPKPKKHGAPKPNIRNLQLEGGPRDDRWRVAAFRFCCVGDGACLQQARNYEITVGSTCSRMSCYWYWYSPLNPKPQNPKPYHAAKPSGPSRNHSATPF